MTALMTARQLASMIGVNDSRIRQLISCGAITALKPGRDWMIDLNEVQAFLMARNIGGAPSSVNATRVREIVQAIQGQLGDAAALVHITEWIGAGDDELGAEFIIFEARTGRMGVLGAPCIFEFNRETRTISSQEI
jgi:excisionase family DNA binding protein